MSRRRVVGEQGTAALEFALFFSLLLGLLAFTAPLVTALQAKAEAGRAAGVAARLGSQVPDRARPGVASAGPANAYGRRPAADEICAQAYREVLPAGITAPGCGVTVRLYPALAGTPPR